MNSPQFTVPAEVLIFTYGQAEMIRLAAAMPLRDASNEAFELFVDLDYMAYRSDHELIPQSQRTLAKLPVGNKGMPTNCLSHACSTALEAMALEPQEQRRLLGPHQSVRVGEVCILDCVWVLETSKRLSNGVPLGDATRQARDLIDHRPGRRRTPWSPEKVSTYASGALIRLWPELRAAFPTLPRSPSGALVQRGRR